MGMVRQTHLAWPARTALLLAALWFFGAGPAAANEITDVFDAVLELTAKIPADARTARGLGTFRRGSGILIDDAGLVLTIGYIVLESNEINLFRPDGTRVRADFVAYDYDTGFGLVRARDPLGVKPIKIGDSSQLEERHRVLVASSGGRENAIGAVVVSRRPFAGYWEYLLENAIFTAPMHNNWGGAALISDAGELLGVGSLFVRDAVRGGRPVAGNMFVPINLLKPIFGDLLTTGRSGGPLKPWLGLFSQEMLNLVVVSWVSPDGPAEEAGLLRGDVIIAVGNTSVSKQIDFYRAVWAQGEAGTDIRLKIIRDGATLEVTVHSGSRYDFIYPDTSY
jgi:S1-C subfamily serine protease